MDVKSIEWWFWYGLCAEPVWDKGHTNDLVNHFTTAFLLDALKGDVDARMLRCCPKMSASPASPTKRR